MRAYAVTVGEEVFRAVVRGGPASLSVEVNGTPHTVEVHPWCGRSHVRLIVDSVAHHVVVSPQGERTVVVVGAERYVVRVGPDIPVARRGSPATARSVLEIAAPMPGVIVSIEVAPEERVEQGRPVAIIEAMKMQMEIHAPAPGRVRAVHVRRGQDVARGTLLVTLDPLGGVSKE